MSSKLTLNTVDIPATIFGIGLFFPTIISIRIETEVDKISFDADVEISLKQFQENFLTLLQNIPMETEKGEGQKIEITGVDAATLTAAGNSALTQAEISCTVWHVCKNDKTALLNETFDAKIKFGITITDNKSIEIMHVEPEVYPRGGLIKFVNWILSFVKGDLNHFVKKQLTKVINEGLLRQALPPEFNKYHPAITVAPFKTLPDSSLGVFVSFNASLKKEELSELVKNNINQ